MAAEERWVGVEDVAAHIGVAKESIYRWIDSKAFPAHRVGRLLRFKLSEVDEWVKASGGDDSPPSSTGRASQGKKRSKGRKSGAKGKGDV